MLLFRVRESESWAKMSALQERRVLSFLSEAASLMYFAIEALNHGRCERKGHVNISFIIELY